MRSNNGDKYIYICCKRGLALRRNAGRAKREIFNTQLITHASGSQGFAPGGDQEQAPGPSGCICILLQPVAGLVKNRKCSSDNFHGFEHKSCLKITDFQVLWDDSVK